MSINIDQVTEVNLQGSGDFDKLMRTVSLHLVSEFERGRINGTDYSTVYLGAMTQVLGQAIQFTLTKDEASKRAELLVAEKAQTEKQTELLEAQRLNAIDELEYRAKQKLLLDEETKLKAAQTNQVEEETKLLVERILIAKEELKIKQQEVNLAIIRLQQAEIEKELTLAQRDKALQEVLLLAQKLVTEKAQVQDSVDGAAIAGVIGKQKALYTAQTDGFARDAEQKATKILLDGATTIFSINEDSSYLSPEITGANYASAIQKLKAGIGAT